MPVPYHGKDGRFRDSAGRIGFEYDRNDPRHIQQQVDHPQLGHKGEYANCWTCHEYIPSSFRTYKEVAANTAGESRPAAQVQIREPDLSREGVALGTQPLALQRAPPVWTHLRGPSQWVADYHEGALPQNAAPEATSPTESVSSNDEPAPARRVESGSWSPNERAASECMAAFSSTERALSISDKVDAIENTRADDATARHLRREAHILEVQAAGQSSQIGRDGGMTKPC